MFNSQDRPGSGSATMTPRVSIVLPTHNGAEFLSEAIASVVAQTLTDWELIVVDDASTDDTSAIIRSWVQRDVRIRQVSLSENVGLPAALNRGFAVASAELHSWTSDDNTYRPNALETLVSAIDAVTGTDLVYADWELVSDSEQSIPMRVKPASLLLTQNVVGPCFVYRSCLHERLGGYDETCFLAEDYDFWLRASQIATFRPVNETLYKYRFHAASLSVTRQRDVGRMTEFVLNRALAQIGDESEHVRAFVAWGRRAAVAGDVVLACRYLRRAIAIAGPQAGIKFGRDLVRIGWQALVQLVNPTNGAPLAAPEGTAVAANLPKL